MDVLHDFESSIKSIPDFPKPGVLFRDISPVLSNPLLCAAIVNELAERWSGVQVDAVAGIESRGFLFGMSLAGKFGVPFVPLRKKGKLPGATYRADYDLEYGTSTLELQTDAVKSGQHVLIHDDLVATGGTALAGADLIRQAGGQVAGFSFLIELEYFKANAKLESVAPVRQLLTF